jgi:[ribosomal protein S18]-alanine N-acetyltransferase
MHENNSKLTDAQCRIRLMCESDIDTIVAMELMTFATDHWFADDFLKVIYQPDWNCCLIESTDVMNPMVLGYGLQQLERDASIIVNFCIHPDFNGCGLGTVLLRHMINHALNIGELRLKLHVHINNHHALQLYHRHGFQISSLLSEFYSDKSDAYEMILDL